MAYDPLRDNPLFDPFVPEKAYLETSEHELVIDVVQTVQNYSETMLPEISATALKEEDLISVEFDNETRTEFLVSAVATKSLVFGADDIIHPTLECLDQDANPIELVGSCISPSGTMMTPGKIMQGYHLATYQDGNLVSNGTISDFRVKRKDKTTGEYAEVSPNQLTQNVEESVEYSSAQARFTQMTEQLLANGFDFDAKDEDEYGYSGYMSYNRTSTEGLVSASRQGFGCMVVPQYEIYTYDAVAGVVRAMRSLPSEGILQMAIMPINPVDLAETGFRGRSWREIGTLEPSNLHRGSHKSPIYTYTWQNPGQTTPTITIKTEGHGLNEEVTRGGKHSYGHTDFAAEVNISVADNTAHSQVVNPQWWVDEERYKSALDEATDGKVDGNYVHCTIGESKMILPIHPDSQMDAMERTFSEVLNYGPRKLGSKALGK